MHDRRILLLVALIFLVTLSSQVVGQWSNPIEVSWGEAPDMDIHPQSGQIHIVAVTKNKELAYTVLSQTGGVMSQENVPGVTSEHFSGHFGPSVAVDTLNFPHIFYRSYVNNNQYDLYYMFKNELGWSKPLIIARRVTRGYAVRIDVDEMNRVHLAYGSAGADVWGPVTYVRVENSAITKTHTNITKYRADDRIEIDSRFQNEVHLVLGCPDPKGGPVTYWRSANAGEQFLHVGDIHHPDCNDRNGSPDVFVDMQGRVHFCYGSSVDASRENKPSVRYTRYENGVKKLDVPVTPANFLKDWHLGIGLASIATSDDGQTVIICFQVIDGGPMYCVQSSNAGQTWSEPVPVSDETWEGYEGRSKQILRAVQQRFYLAYPAANGKIYLRWFQFADTENPVAEAGGPYYGREGAMIRFDASKSKDNTGIISYEWDWNADGLYDDKTDQPVIEHLFQDNYTGKINLRVRDTASLTATDDARVTIENTNPIVVLPKEFLAKEGSPFTFKANVTDSGALDTHTYLWNFGDGSTSNEAVPVHQYADDGEFAITCEVKDKDGGIGLAKTKMKVQNVSPTVDAGGPYLAMSGDTITFIGKATDPGTADILTYAWDLDNDGTYEAEGVSVKKVFVEKGNFKVRLQVKDDDGGEGVDEADVKIGNAPPTVNEIPGQTIQQNEKFQDIQLDLYVSDLDNTPAEMTWMAKGMVNLTVIIDNRIAKIAVINPDWKGSEKIKFIVQDPDGLTDSTIAVFSVLTNNQAPVVQSMSDQTVLENQPFQIINLDKQVSDPDNSPAEMKWTFYGNKNLNILIRQGNTSQNNINSTQATQWTATIAVADSEWNGTEMINFVVTDPGQLSDTTTAKFTVVRANDAPQIGKIPAQMINPGGEFPTLELDNYVFDPDNAKESLVWTYSGNQELNVEIQNRMAKIKLPKPDWKGSEVIRFKATDPEGASGQRDVTFTIVTNNKRPELANMFNISINEDDTARISRKSLETLVYDPDNQPADFTFSILASKNIIWGTNQKDKGLYITSAPDWNGKEKAMLVVHDGAGGRDSSSFMITIKPVADSPSRFELIAPLGQNLPAWPSTLKFSWQRAVDPDGDAVQYIWILSRTQNCQDTLHYSVGPDTVYNLVTANFVTLKGDLFWKVLAYSQQDNKYRECEKIGHFSIQFSGVETAENQIKPDQFLLLQNYPNPFNPETHITYQLPEPTNIRLEIFNMQGELVQVLDAGDKTAGMHTAIWNGLNQKNEPVSSGLYLYRLQADRVLLIQKMMLMK
ncbi:PKD domain-containing protein [candidate division KSB1 bacterium]|nr:PKD domain-containing protein [candidate division KSB1 bacterium]